MNLLIYIQLTDREFDSIHNMPKKIVEVEYEVQSILSKRVVDGKVEYQVWWKGYFQHQATWEPQEYLANSKNLIQKFQKQEKSKLKKAIKEKKYEEKRKQIEATYSQQKIRFQQLSDLLLQHPFYHKHVQDTQKQQTEQLTGHKTFQDFINNPPNQIVKIRRYDSVKGEWKDKLQTCAEIVAKGAAKEKKQLSLSQQRIQIIGVSTIDKKINVRFQINKQRHQCKLDELSLLRPNQIIDFILQHYDPSQNKLKLPKETQQYLSYPLRLQDQQSD